MDQEEWKPVVGFEGLYEVSNLGRVRRSGGAGKGAQIGKILKPGRLSYGHRNVCLRKDGKNNMRQVHRLVALAFLGPPPSPIHQVAHWDGNPSNNCVSNLRWATPKENGEDRVRHGTQVKGEAVAKRFRGVKNPRAKMDPDKIRAIRKDPRTQQAIADDYGINQAAVSCIKRRATWAHVED